MIYDGLPSLDDVATDKESLVFLHTLIGYLKPLVVVEAGTYKGHFSVPAARMLPHSTVMTADVTKFLTSKEDNLYFFEGDFEDMLATCHIPPIDFAFIDSGPPQLETEPGIRWRHWNACKEYMRPGGIMACHDTNATDWEHAHDIIADGIRLKGGRGLVLCQI